MNKSEFFLLVFYFSFMVMVVVIVVILSYCWLCIILCDWLILNLVLVVIDKLVELVVINIGGKKYEIFEYMLN